MSFTASLLCHALHLPALPCPALPSPQLPKGALHQESEFVFDCIDAISIANPNNLYKVCLLAKNFTFMFGCIILMMCLCWGSHLDVHPRLKSLMLKCCSSLVPQELEKFKFVLDYKIKELKKQIEPKEEQIADMKDQVKVCCAMLC